MQNPFNDIRDVMKRLTTAKSPDIQKETIDKNFAEDVALRSPFFNIPSGPLSREDVLGVYQWYRVLSPKNQMEITNLVFDQRNSTLYLEISHIFHIRFSPFKSAPSRSIARLKLRKEGKVYVIVAQEEFYHPDDLMNLLAPPLAPVVRFMMLTTSYASAISAKFAQVFGYWRVGAGESYPSDSDDSQSQGDSEDTSRADGRAGEVWNKAFSPRTYNFSRLVPRRPDLKRSRD
ncbi:hypothetical protein LshimejAT787_1201280 [Lyophyllum shimeji]|uniref:SigF-like NTF2-like domain-containing protein n=1 Tax=Lyophyllum shimeji TaxID=47721 RepID=A0A9P3PW57_LYOSH|nr:hypothetical protein LshimejAT787_1201280 [Lyophyllum shimeji]